MKLTTIRALVLLACGLPAALADEAERWRRYSVAMEKALAAGET